MSALGWNQVWEKIPPKYRQIAVYASAFACILLMSYLFVSGGNSRKKAVEDKKVQRDILTPKRLNEFGMSGLAHDLEEANRKIDQLTKQMAKLLETKETRNGQEVAKLAQLKQDMERQVQEIRKEKDQKNQEEANPRPAGASKPSAPSAPGAPKGNSIQPGKEKTAEPVKKELAKTSLPGTPLAKSRVAKDIRVITAETGSHEASGPDGQPGRTEFVRGNVRKAKVNEEKGTFVSAGAIFSGTLLTGMDAPCGQAARRDPFPVLLRVKKEAILPNRFNADVRECFLIASGYGDISSERAYLRSERLSCIRQDGKALENRVEMFATGEDGKAGIRGRLVSKQGVIIGRALVAGFMQGFSQMFGKTPVMTLNIPQNGLQQATPFQRNLSKDAVEAAGIAGVGNALDNLSKYYLDMAKDMFPVVEIDAGRQVDFITIAGFNLKLQGN